MAALPFSKDFKIDSGIFTSAEISLGATTDGNAQSAILSNAQFPPGDIQIGHISITADTGTITVKPTAR